MEKIEDHDPLDTRQLCMSYSTESPLLREPDVDHTLPRADGYANVLAIIECDAVRAQISHQEGLLPQVTPETLTSIFEDRRERVAEAQRLRPVLGELIRLRSLLPSLGVTKALAVTSMRRTCWLTFPDPPIRR